MAEQIHQFLNEYTFFQQNILPYHRTVVGQSRYQQLLEINRDRYPEYLVELEGLSQGAERPFEDIFLINMRGEYQDCPEAPDARGCSDCVIVTEEAALIGHNEDGSPLLEGRLALVRARVEGKPAFTALAYPGFLCGNAFGFNSQGICFSVDNVHPKNHRVGVSRQFLARSLLEASSLQDAIAKLTVPGRASGFSYTIGSIAERRVIQIEVAPESHHIREIQGFSFHANHYQELTEVDQVIEPSSQMRVERANSLLQDNLSLKAKGILTVLGDRANDQYPIHRKATQRDPATTFCTSLFDLDARLLQIYTGHPIDDPEECISFQL
jgi:predicted choloylglycine hydrolase